MNEEGMYDGDIFFAYIQVKIVKIKKKENTKFYKCAHMFIYHRHVHDILTFNVISLCAYIHYTYIIYDTAPNVLRYTEHRREKKTLCVNSFD